MNKSKGDPYSAIAKAHRICYSKPLLFYKERTRKQAVDDLVRESQPTQQKGKTMSENEIMLALECCSVEHITCQVCPLFGDPFCHRVLAKNALSRIEAKNAEIESWKKQNIRLNEECEHYLNYAINARKEFAENLKQEIKKHRLEMCLNGMKGTHRTDEMTYETIIEYIDNLLEEMGC